MITISIISCIISLGGAIGCDIVFLPRDLKEEIEIKHNRDLKSEGATT
jgi:hypothetical protein